MLLMRLPTWEKHTHSKLADWLIGFLFGFVTAKMKELQLKLMAFFFFF